MKFFARRRLKGAAITAAALGLVWLWDRRLELSLRPTNFFTGWLLLASVFFLAAFNLRKKFPAPPLGSSTAWLQAHIYTGLGTAGLYLLHAPFRWPNGVLETTLTGLYWSTFASGLLGLYWTRTLPRRLSRVSEEIVYERIAALRGGLRDRAQATVLAAVRTGGATMLGDFYQRRLHDFFSNRRGWRYRFRPTSRLRKSLMAELTELDRYLSEDERRTSEELFALVRKRDDLDYHEALQWRLKAWLFVHIALTYPLLVAAALHGWLAHLYHGGLP